MPAKSGFPETGDYDRIQSFCMLCFIIESEYMPPSAVCYVLRAEYLIPRPPGKLITRLPMPGIKGAAGF